MKYQKGHKPSEETREKMREAHKRRKLRDGYTISLETQKKMHETRSRNRYKHSKETKNKIGKSNKGKKRTTEMRLLQSLKSQGSGGNNWKGGRKMSGQGYVEIYSNDHPFKKKSKYVFEHRLVMEAHIGRTLLPSEVVHHINGIHDDNRIENLMLFSSNADHQGCHHPKGKKVGL